MKLIPPSLPADLPVSSDPAGVVAVCAASATTSPTGTFSRVSCRGISVPYGIPALPVRRRPDGRAAGSTTPILWTWCFPAAICRGRNLSGCGFLRCRFENCKGVGTAFVHSPMRHVVLEGSPLRMANFSETPFKAVRFSGCDLTESVFLQCVPQDLSFESCKLVKINFCRTRLAGIDFSANQLEGILISGDELRDAVVSPLQAVELARLLGVRVKDG